jgi:hypothetical protein
MLEANKKKLDWWYFKKTFLLPICFLVILVIAFINYYWFATEKVNEFQNSSKFPVVGIFKSSGEPRAGRLCFFEVETQTIPIRCPNETYHIGQKVKLTKVITKSGSSYFVIGTYH